jgi:hypothetical protein
MHKIGIYDDFLDEDIFIECQYYSDRFFNTTHKDIELNINKWQKDIVLDSEIIYIKKMKECDLFYKIQQNILQKLGHKITSICFTYFTPSSHIPWHDDYKYNGGLTIYLNEYWNNNNGGLFMFEDKKNNEIRAIFPKRNRAIEQIGGVRHSVCPTTKKSDIRKTIQMFF